VDRLQDIPNHAKEIATHGVRQEATTALDVVQTCTGHKLLLLVSVFPGEESRAGFDELVLQFNVAIDTIGNEVSADM